MQDSKGYIWISTSKGVVKYNPKELKAFTKEDGLSDNTIFGAYEDPKGRIWFRTYNGKLNYYYKDSIFSSGLNEEIGKYLEKRIISKIYVDKNDNLWLSRYGSSDLLHADPFKTQKISVVKSNSPLSLKVFDEKQYLFSFENFYKLSHVYLNIINKNRSSKKELELKLSVNSNLLYYNDSNYVISTGSQGYILVVRNNVVKELHFKNRVIDVFRDGNDILVSLFKNGVYCYNPDDLSKPIYHLLEGLTVTSFLKDFEGGFWFSTLENGVYYKRSLKNYQYIFSTLPYSNSIRFFTKQNNKLFLGTDGPALLYVNDSLKHGFLDVSYQPHGYNLNDMEYFDSKYYAAGYGLLKEYDSNLKLLRNINGIRDEGLKLRTGFKQIKFLNKNEYIIADGVRVNLGRDSFIYKQIHLPFRVTLFKYDSLNRNIYIGTSDGLYTVKKFDQVEKDTFGGFQAESIRAIALTKDRHLLICAQQKGLYLKINNRYVKLFYEKNTLSNSIDVDQENNIWLGTNRGIVYLKKNGPGYTPYFITKSDGLQSNEINFINCFKDYIWYTTNNGLYYFKPSDLLKESIPPKIEIEAVFINGTRQYDFADLLLNYNENNIQVQASSLSFLPGDAPTILYRLLGYDSAWKNTNSENMINYTNLPPGKYQLQVMGVNCKNVKSLMSRSLPFEITPPFWKTWWFLLLMVLLTVFIVSAFVNLYIRAVRKKENEKARIERLLSEFQMTALRAQINPHFIFNCISSIQALMLKDEIETAYTYLQKFSKLLRLVLENSKKNFISLRQEMEVVSLYVGLEQMRFDDSFIFMLDVDKGIDEEMTKVPYMILQPVVENAIWHGLMHSNKKEKRISIHISQKNNDLTIEVTDNGIGRKKSNEYKRTAKSSMGENITSDRLNIMNDHNSKRAFIKITDLTDTNGEATGTKVELNIPQKIWLTSEL
jgi:hypothetical protein